MGVPRAGHPSCGDILKSLGDTRNFQELLALVSTIVVEKGCFSHEEDFAHFDHAVSNMQAAASCGVGAG